MPDQPPPPRHDQLLVVGGGDGLEVRQRGVGGVLGELTPLGLARSGNFLEVSKTLDTKRSLILWHFQPGEGHSGGLFRLHRLNRFAALL